MVIDVRLFFSIVMGCVIGMFRFFMFFNLLFENVIRWIYLFLLYLLKFSGMGEL